MVDDRRDSESLPTVTAKGLPASDQHIGPYRLLEQLGAGGMGEVWLAEQTHPVRRRVAVKLIKAGMDTRQLIARFEAERQALALMDHPAIAKVFDAGATPLGRPYFAMEYVRGEALTTFCERKRLSVRERLELFVRVCEAVQHAHQKGIIHRDLKPANILVAERDDRPDPKIIDFGIAKALTQPLTDQTLHTAMDALIGTPEYLSPEQASRGAVDVDTRSDVYALGVILYELLTGRLPFDRQVLRSMDLDGIRRTIRETEPPRPSAAVVEPGDRAHAAARSRQAEPARLASLLRGDLDWITMRALEKDRARRYGSASDLAADLVRHLTHQPVVAGPPGIAYRSRKFVRRHRVGVAAGAGLVAMLVIVTAAMAVQAQRIAHERDRANREAEVARQVSAFLVGLFDVAKPSEQTANTITAREILDRGADRIRQTSLDPATRATLLATMGDVYRSLAMYATARTLHEEALTLRQGVFGPESAEVAESLTGVARTLRRLDRLDDAVQLEREALAMRRRLFPHDDPVVADSLSGLGWALISAAQFEEAESLLREALVIQRSRAGAELQLADTVDGLAAVLLYTGDLTGAEATSREALNLRSRLHGPGHPRTAAAADNLANALLLQGHYAEAEAIYRSHLDETIRTLGPDHPEVAISKGNIGAALYFQEKYAEAESVYREALAVARRAYGDEHSEIARAQLNLAESLMAQRRYAEALAETELGLRMVRRVLGRDHPFAAFALIVLSKTRLGLDQPTEAEAAADEALAISLSRFGVDHPRTTEARAALSAARTARR